MLSRLWRMPATVAAWPARALASLPFRGGAARSKPGSGAVVAGGSKRPGAAPIAAAPALAGKRVTVQAGMSVAELAKATKMAPEAVAAMLVRMQGTTLSVTGDTDVPVDLAQLLVLDACVR